ncbi:MAG: hypothetical protein ACYCO9_13400 [Streptosporangiaceae bacterium]
MTALAEAGDYGTRGRARQVLRQARRDDSAEFDAEWQETDEPLPAWRAHPDTSDADEVIAWVRTPDWDQSRTYLDGHAARPLTGQGEATLEHLIDANPGAAELREYLALLQAARADGVAAAYAAHRRWRATRRASQLLEEWIGTRTWEESRVYAQAHAGGLLSDDSAGLLDDLAVLDPGDLTLRAHRGLLGCAAAAGTGTA